LRRDGDSRPDESGLSTLTEFDVVDHSLGGYGVAPRREEVVVNKQDRAAWTTAACALSIVAVLMSFATIVVVAGDDNAGGGGGGPTTATVTLSEFAIAPTPISIGTGAALTVTNSGSQIHNLFVEGSDPALNTTDLAPGATEVLDLGGLADGSYKVSCSIAGHRDAGMLADLVVGDATATSGSTPHADDPQALLAANDALDAAQLQPVEAYVAQLTDGANTEGVGNQPLAPTVLGDGTKQFELTASVIDWEVEPGKIVQAWAYNDQVPGPMIKVNVGDSVAVVLHNDLPQSTSIHFHGLQVPVAQDGVPFVAQDPVKPGDDFTYRFTVTEPAVAMYHSHHHAEHQVPDGLLGAFIVGAMPLPANTGPVTQEVPMILNDAGAIGLSLNAKSFPATAPIMAKVGDWVEIQYMNEGLQIHPMHLHGIPQLVIAKDGFPLDVPYFADTVNVAPGERYTVLVHPEDRHRAVDGKPGIWAFHCHILNHAERASGMFGMVTTFIVT
jgi:plastocyanin